MTTVISDGAGDLAVRGAGVFRRVLRHIMTGRELQARRYIDQHLRTLDDATLAAYGADRKALSKGITANYPW